MKATISIAFVLVGSICVFLQVVHTEAQDLSPEEGHLILESQWNPADLLNGQQNIKRSLVLLDEESDDDEEQDCRKGHYFHIRGRRCVPFRCKGGNQYRDSATGQCIIGSFKNVGSISAQRQRTIWKNPTPSRSKNYHLRMGLGGRFRAG